jgi:oligosaccharide repeat unit polymerase
MLLVLVWAAAVLIYLLGPVRYHDQVRAETWLFVIACVLAFAAGALAGRWPRVPFDQDQIPEQYYRRVETAVILLAAIGVLGAVSLIVERLFFSGIDYSAGFTAARVARAEEIAAGMADVVRRTPLLYFGYLAFPFAVPAYLLYVLAAERLGRISTVMAHLSLFAPISYAIIYGARSPLAVLLGLVVGATLVRYALGKPVVPAQWLGRLFIGGAVVALVIYSGYIFAQRRALSNLDDSFGALEDRFETIYAATITPAIGDAVDEGRVAPSTAVNLAMTYFYFTHEIPMLDRTLRAERFGPYLGQYQFYLPAAAVWRLLPELSSERRMITEAQAANTYGWFSSAWGSMYLDFGVAGALFMIAVCGWISEQAFERVRRRGSLGAQLALCYAFCGIIASPVLSIFTISVSTLFLVAIIGAIYLVRRPIAGLATPAG